MILTALGLACAGCACVPAVPGAASARAGQPTETRIERHGKTIVIDWSQGAVRSVALDANRALTFVNGRPGDGYALAVTQDATGSRMVTWPANVRWPGGSPPTLTTTAGKTDYVNFIYNGARRTYDGVGIAQNF